MNEKIKQLSLQAGITTTDYGSGPFLDEDDIDLDRLEKFAELVLRECYGICKQHPSRIVANNWNADAVAPHIVHELVEHFGVEE